MMMPLSEQNSHFLMGTLISLMVYYECSCGGGHSNECLASEDSRNIVIKVTKDFPLNMTLNFLSRFPMIIANYGLSFAWHGFSGEKITF